jgi:hypothetical protein
VQNRPVQRTCGEHRDAKTGGQRDRRRKSAQRKIHISPFIVSAYFTKSRPDFSGITA